MKPGEIVPVTPEEFRLNEAHKFYEGLYENNPCVSLPLNRCRYCGRRLPGARCPGYGAPHGV